MSLNFIERVSEAPHERAEQLHELLDELDLPDARLSPEQLELVVNAVAARPDLWQDLIVADHQSRWWLLLYRTPGFEVKLLTWENEQSSDWHDHGGSSGAFRVTQGSVRELHRAKDSIGVDAAIFAPGGYGSFGTDYVHDVVHESGDPAVSIHAYSPPLSGLTYYERTRFGFIARAFIEEERRSTFRTTLPRAQD
jgi:hypothetical protein